MVAGPNTPPVQAPLQVNSLAELDLALHELSWLHHRHRIVQESIQQEIDRLKQSKQTLFEVTVNGRVLTISARLAEVQQIIQAWCDTQLDASLTTDKKSLDLPHGRVGKRGLPLTVECVENVKPKDVLDKLDRKTGFRDKVAAITSKLIGRLSLGMFIEFKPQLSLISLRNAFKAKRITEKQLNGYGLAVRKESEETFFDPVQYQTDPNNPH